MAEQAVSSVLQLSAFTKITWILRENKHRDFPVAVRLKAAEMTVRVKPPVDIVAAIDISGSMREGAGPSKQKKLDLIKQAMEKVIKNISGAMNRIAVVPFDENTRLVQGLTEMSEEGHRSVSAAVKDFKPDGDTNFQVALEKAATILKDRKDHNDSLAFIIFLSDGEDDKFRLENIKDSLGYPIHTFGFISNKAKDPTALKAMADASSGSYTRVNEDLDKITEKLDQLTAERITSMVAIDTIVHLKTLHPGVSLLKIESSVDDGSSDGSKSEISENNRSAEIFVGVMSSGEQREFTVFLDVPEGHGNGTNGAMDLLEVSGSYKQSWDRKQVALGESIVTVERPGATSCCKELLWIMERMEYWCKVKLDLSAMYEKEEAEAGVKCKSQCQIQQVLREASLEVTNKEMHHDIYTAVVHAIKLRQCVNDGVASTVTENASLPTMQTARTLG